MTKATHNGTCQVCGNEQAEKGGLAKHGYTVQWNYFHGTCRGSHKQPLEFAKDLTLETIDRCIAHAITLEAKTIADIYKVPVSIITKDANSWRGIRETVLKTRDEWEAMPRSYGTIDGYGTFEEIQTVCLHKLHREATGLRGHAAMLEERIVMVHGKPLKEREELQRVRESFKDYKSAYARKVELEVDGWKSRITRRQYDLVILTASK